MSREETALTIGGSIFGSLFSHIFCCGLLPFALNASASAVLGGLGMQIGMAIITTLAVATGVTLFEKHRHQTTCKTSGHCGCVAHFHFQKHFIRNLIIGICAYSFFAVVTHLPGIHDYFERHFGI